MSLLLKKIGISLLLLRPDVLSFGFGLVFLATALDDINLRAILLLLLFGVICLYGGSNTLDEFNDSLLDQLNRTNRIIHTTINYRISKRWAFSQSIILFILAMVGFFYFFSIVVSIIGLIAGLFGISYAFSVFNIKSRGIPRVLWNVIPLTLLFVLSFIAQGGVFNFKNTLWLIFVILSLFVVVLVNDIKDFVSEKKFGWNTLVVQLGIERYGKLIGYLNFLPLLFVFVCILLGYFSRILLLSFILLIPLKTKASILMLNNPLKNKKQIALLGLTDISLTLYLFSFLLYFSKIIL